MNKACFHLPGLFSFHDLYEKFLDVYENHREFFYEWCEISSVYGSPEDCLWGGGRVEEEDTSPSDALKLMEKHHLSSRLTFSNSLLQEEDLKDYRCNHLADLFFQKENGRNGVIISSDLLRNYLKGKYENIYFVSSTTKVLTRFADLKRELDNPDYSYVVPDFRFNKKLDLLRSLTEEEKKKTEFLCNECCSISCTKRKECYENVSRLNLGLDPVDYVCPNADKGGYSFEEAMKNPSFISKEDIKNAYLPMGFSNFKIEGRGLDEDTVLEMLLYYLVKPECRECVKQLMK